MKQKLFLRYGLKLNGKCCHNYKPPKECLQQIGTNASYEKVEPDGDGWVDIPFF